jgi:hypothetical protein
MGRCGLQVGRREPVNDADRERLEMLVFDTARQQLANV